MGRDKASLCFAGQTLLERAAAIIAPLVNALYVSCRPERPYPGFSLVFDEISGAGPVAGIMAGLRLTGGDKNRRLLVIACDLPLLNDEILAPLLNPLPERKLARIYRNRATGYLEMGAALYSGAALPFFEQAVAQGYGKLGRILTPEALDIMILPEEWAWRFLNCNSPAELVQAELAENQG